jgi:hypothetical protein
LKIDQLFFLWEICHEETQHFFSSHRLKHFTIDLVRTRRQHNSRHLIFEWRKYQQLYHHFFDMYHHLLYWWKRIINRDLTLNNYIHSIINQMYIKNIVKNFNSSWTNIICRRQNVRITLFSLFHENVELTQFIQRMLLSWLVNVKKDDETLKNIKIDI